MIKVKRKHLTKILIFGMPLFAGIRAFREHAPMPRCPDVQIVAEGGVIA